MADNLENSNIEDAKDLTASEDVREKVYTQADIDALKSVAAKERARAAVLEDAAKKIDPKEYQQLKQAAEEQKAIAEKERKDKALAEGRYQDLIADERLAKEKALAELQQTRKEANASIIESKLGLAFIEAKGMPSRQQIFLKLAAEGLSLNESREIVLPSSAIREDGTVISSLKDYVEFLRDKQDLGFAFEPLNKAQGSSDPGGKVPQQQQVKQVSRAEAYKYTKEIIAGSVKVIG